MKKELLYLIFFTCSISIPAIAQVSTSHYNFMYNVIMDTLQLDKAYVSDSLRESEYLGFEVVENVIPIDTLARMIDYPRAEYSELLHSKFNSIEDINTPLNPCGDLIYFSFLYQSYICAEVYLCAKPTKKTDMFPFPQWGYYHERFSFLFQLTGDSIVFVDKKQVHEM